MHYDTCKPFYISMLSFLLYWQKVSTASGLFFTYLALYLMDGHGQPALLYLVPCTLGNKLCYLAFGRLHPSWITINRISFSFFNYFYIHFIFLCNKRQKILWLTRWQVGIGRSKSNVNSRPMWELIKTCQPNCSENYCIWSITLFLFLYLGQ